MIDKVDANPPLIESGSSSGQPNSAGAPPDNEADVSVQVDYASLIDKAMQSPQADTQLVRQARELLLSGQLESPENTRKAAESIIKLGI
ncbi:MAG: hypothetical protein ACYSYV_08390 [Planctomycetota bacterium]|jgi:hypothetical protein